MLLNKKILLICVFLIIFSISAVNAADNITDEVMMDEDAVLEEISDSPAISQSDNDGMVENEDSNHYGYWLYSSDMYNVDLENLSDNGVSDIFIHSNVLSRYNQSIFEDWIAQTNEKGINVHLWSQIFYSGGNWVKPVNDGIVNQNYFDSKTAQLVNYTSIKGLSGIHYDYLMFSGSAKYNNTAEQNPGGMEAITAFVQQSTTAIRESNPNIIISAAIMPETDVLKTWYGVDYVEITKYFDLITPMIYTGNFRQNATWIRQTTEWFVNSSSGADVWTGLQGYTVQDINEEYIEYSPFSQISIEAKSAFDGGAKGVIIFRIGVTRDVDFVNLPIDEEEFTTFNNLDYLISCSKYVASLNSDFVYNASHDANYVNGVGIHRNNLIIDGNNHVIDGAGLARIFNVSGINITFRNINFVNGYSSQKGGAIYATGSNLTVINCTFTGGIAEIEAGAIFARLNYTQIINSTFINNRAVYTGALYINGVNSSVIGSCFENNVANISAGAIGWAKKDNGLIKDSVFVNNSALNEGGGAIFWNQGNNGKILNSKFVNNYAIFNGSAIYWANGCGGIIADSIFTNNTASDNGGAIYHKGSGNKISNSTFINNTARFGQAIYTKDNLDVLGCSFTSDNETYAEGNATINFKINLIMTAKSAKYIINYGGSYTVELKDQNGNAIPGEKITFTLNGKYIGYSLTNKKGVATIKLTAKTLKAIKSGNKNLIVKLDSKMYNASSKTVKITVKKEKPKITAKKKTFRLNVKTKKYTIMLKTSKSKVMKKFKVYLKVKGKTYKATTNNKGKALFKIKNLKKAKTFKAKVVFKANNYYYKVTKVVNLKVKR